MCNTTWYNFGPVRAVLRAEGADVVVADIDGEAAGSSAAALDPNGEHAIAFATDVTVQSDLDALVAAAVERWGKTDVLAANAGVYPHIPLAELTPDSFDHLMRSTCAVPCSPLRPALDRCGAMGTVASC
jgi:NAD(P)-dependent dehydrogenase (short-subunit alcohol dehydrogenase family)